MIAARVGSLGNEHRGVAVAKAVEPDLGVEADSEGGWLEVAGVEVGLPHRGAASGREYKLGWVFAAHVVGGVLGETTGEANGPSSAVLGRSKLKLAVGLAGGCEDEDLHRGQVYSGYSQGCDLTGAQPGEPGEADQEAPFGKGGTAMLTTTLLDGRVSHFLGYSDHLIGSEEDHLLLRLLRRLGVGDRVVSYGT